MRNVNVKSEEKDGRWNLSKEVKPQMHTGGRVREGLNVIIKLHRRHFRLVYIVF